MVTMFATLLSFANGNSLFKVENDAKKTALTLYNVKQGNLLSVIDEKGVILYKETIQRNGVYNKGFDLTQLPDGSYFFELDKDLEISSIPFKVKDNTVVFDKENEKTIFKPFMRIKDDLVYITKLALDGIPLEIEIYFTEFDSEEYELIFKEKTERTLTIERIFKLEGLELGTYKIVFHSEGKEFTKIIKS